MRRQPPDHAEQLLHPRAAADHAAELEPPRQVPFHREDAAPPIDLLANAGQQLVEAAEVERLAQVVHRPELDRLDRGVDRGVAGHEHGLTVRVDIANRAQDVEAADLRHPQVDHHQVGPPRLDQRDGRAAVGTDQHVEAGAFGETRHDVEDTLLVVDDYQQWSWIRHAPPTRSRITAASAVRSARNWNGGTSTALACSCPKCSASLSSAAVDITTMGTGTSTGTGPRTPRLEIGREDPAVDERHAQAAAQIARQALIWRDRSRRTA